MGLGDPTIDRDEKQLAYETALKSRTFARSEQLQGFLRYICEMELSGRGGEISEYSIATVALNRRANYAPGEDSSVRSRAHSLRRKLHEFYETEMPEAEWRIELPKGSYRPLFVSRYSALPATTPAAVPVPAPLKITAPPREKAARSWVRPFVFGVALTVVVGALLFPVLSGRWRGNAIDAVVREAWGPALATGSDVLIVVGCPPTLRLSRTGKGNPPKSFPPAPASKDVLDWYEAQNVEHHGEPLYIMPSRGYTVFADTHAVTEVTSLVTLAGATFQTTPETYAQLMAVHERGLVVIGAPAYTDLAARMLKSTPFGIRYDRNLTDEVITDGQAVFAPKRNSANRFSTVYGLITVLPSQPGRSRPERTLIFSGITGSPGAQAAVQFFASPAAMQDLLARFRKEGLATFPPAYQVVVRCGVDREAAINSVYETHRVMRTPPVIE